MEWTNSSIDIWFFSQANVPESLYTATPDTSTFGAPGASFSGPCSDNFSKKFFNHTIVIDTTFCGGWGGGTFGKGEDTQCSLTGTAGPESSCKDYVANNPEAFNDTYWGIKSLTIWQRATGFEPQFNAAQVTTTLPKVWTTIQSTVQSTVTIALSPATMPISDSEEDEDTDYESLGSTDEPETSEEEPDTDADPEDGGEETLPAGSPLTSGLLTMGDGLHMTSPMNLGIDDGTTPSTSSSLLGNVQNTDPSALLVTNEASDKTRRVVPAQSQKVRSQRLAYDDPTETPSNTTSPSGDDSDIVLTQGVLRIIPTLLDALAKLTGLSSQEILDELATILGNLPDELQSLPMVQKLSPMILFIKSILPVQPSKRQARPLPVVDTSLPDSVFHSSADRRMDGVLSRTNTVNAEQAWCSIPSDVQSQLVVIAHSFGSGNSLGAGIADTGSSAAGLSETGTVNTVPTHLLNTPAIVQELNAALLVSNPPDTSTAKAGPFDTEDAAVGIGALLGALDPNTQHQILSLVDWSTLPAAEAQARIKRGHGTEDAVNLREPQDKPDWSHNKLDWQHDKPHHPHWPHRPPYKSPPEPHKPWPRPNPDSNVDYEDLMKFIQKGKLNDSGKRAVLIALIDGTIPGADSPQVIRALAARFGISSEELDAFMNSNVYRWLGTDAEKQGYGSSFGHADSESNDDSSDPLADYYSEPDGIDDPDTDWPYMRRRHLRNDGAEDDGPDITYDDDGGLSFAFINKFYDSKAALYKLKAYAPRQYFELLKNYGMVKEKPSVARRQDDGANDPGLDITYDDDGGLSFAFITDIYDPKAAWYDMNRYAKKQYLELLKEYGYLPKDTDVDQATKDLWHWMFILGNLGDPWFRKDEVDKDGDDGGWYKRSDTRSSSKGDPSNMLDTLRAKLLVWLKTRPGYEGANAAVNNATDGQNHTSADEAAVQADDSSLWRTSFRQTTKDPEPNTGTNWYRDVLTQLEQDNVDPSASSYSRQGCYHPKPEVSEDTPKVPSFYDFEDEAGPGDDNWYLKLTHQLGEEGYEDDGLPYDDSYIPEHPDENAGSDYDWFYRTDHGKPWNKFLDALKVPPSQLSEVNGPATGEMVKGKQGGN
jgi:hypothetical protein